MFFGVDSEAAKKEKEQPQSQREIEKAIKKAQWESQIRREVLNNMPKSSQSTHVQERVRCLTNIINYDFIENVEINPSERGSNRMVSEEDGYREEGAEQPSVRILSRKKMRIESEEESSQKSEEKDVSIENRNIDASEGVFPNRSRRTMFVESESEEKDVSIENRNIDVSEGVYHGMIAEEVLLERRDSDIESIKWVIENILTEESLQKLSDTFIGGMLESLAGRGMTIGSSKELPTSIPNGTVQKMNTEGEKSMYRMQFSYPAENQNPMDWIKNNFGQLEGTLKKAFAAKMTEQFMKSLSETSECKKISKKEEKNN
jgi:hypothetical protein